MNLLDKHRNDIQKLCSDHNVKQLYAFGSVLTNEFDKQSDVDLIVNFQTNRYCFLC